MSSLFILLTFDLDDGESEEGRIAGEADCFWEDHQAKWDVVESSVVALLLSICEGGGVD